MKIEKILKLELEKINVPEKELEKISLKAKIFLSIINKALEKKASGFIGGSLAKGTIIKKNKYDIDIFIRFKKNVLKEKDNISDILEKALKANSKKFKILGKNIRIEKMHGSRDYFNMYFYDKEIKKDILFEIVPTLEIKPSEAENVIDLSFFHINYIVKQLKKNKKLGNEIKLAKAFCFANKCYGAESYISGFSGYALELLVCRYKSFLNLVRAASKWNTDKKVIIDIGKYYRKKNVLYELNEDKLQSPIILIDPTFKLRNVAASVSDETFKKFILACKEFLKNSKKDSFSIKEPNLTDLKKDTKTKNTAAIEIEAKSNKKGEIAGAKLQKFLNFLETSLKKNGFVIVKKEWLFQEPKAKYCIIYKSKKFIKIIGPPVKLKDACEKFKKMHKKTIKEKGRLILMQKVKNINFVINEIKKRKEIKDMGIYGLRIIKKINA